MPKFYTINNRPLVILVRVGLLHSCTPPHHQYQYFGLRSQWYLRDCYYVEKSWPVLVMLYRPVLAAAHVQKVSNGVGLIIYFMSLHYICV